MVEPFDETELEDLNNFYLYINPADKVVPGPSVYRWLATKVNSLDTTPRVQFANGSCFNTDSYKGYSDLYLDQPKEQFLSAIENTAAEISGSFEAAQTACCKWRKTRWSPPPRPMTGPEMNEAIDKHEQLIESNAEWKADIKAWQELQNRIYRTLRQRGYARRELIG